MPVYIKGTDGSDSNLSLLGVSGGQQRFSYWHSGQIDADANGLAGLEQFLRRVTVSGSTSDSPANKSSTRSPTERATPRNASTWTVVGSPLVCLAIGETHVSMGFWRPPRPWAAPVITDTEQFGLDRPFRTQSSKYGWDEDGPITRDLCRPTRRPRRNGLFHYSNQKTVRQLSKNGFPKIRNWWCAAYDDRYRRQRSGKGAAEIQLLTSGGGGGSTPVNDSDSMALTDAATLVVVETATDTITLTDVVSALTAALSGSDSEVISDASSLKAAFTTTDSVSETDASVIVAVFTGSDSTGITDTGGTTAGIGTSDVIGLSNASTLAAFLTGLDSVALSEISGLVVFITGTESITMSDASVIVTPGNFIGVDSISLTESVIAGAKLTQTDTLVITDAQSLAVALSSQDSAVLTSQFSALSAALTALDEIDGIDNAQIAAALAADGDIIAFLDTGGVITGYMLKGTEAKTLLGAELEGTSIVLISRSAPKLFGATRDSANLKNARLD